MLYEEFREIMDEYPYKIEEGEDKFIILAECIVIDNKYCFRGVRVINLVGEKTLWFDNMSVDLKDIESFEVCKVMSVLDL